MCANPATTTGATIGRGSQSSARAQVDLPHIERAVDQLLKKDGGLQLYQGEILASYYLDGLAEDVHQALQAGPTRFEPLATRQAMRRDPELVRIRTCARGPEPAHLAVILRASRAAGGRARHHR